MFIGPEFGELSQIIGITAKNIYGEFQAKMTDKPPHMAGVCTSLSVAMRDRLAELGISAHIISSPYQEGRFPLFHDFISIPNASGDPTLVDLGWQHLLPQPDDSKPKVLISRRSRLPQVLTYLGVPPDKHHYWLEAS